MAKYLLVNRIKDQSVRNAVSKALQDDGRLSFHDVRAILGSALDGDGVTPQEFSDLKAILANAKTLDTSSRQLIDGFLKKYYRPMIHQKPVPTGQLTTNFDVSEFACKDGTAVPLDLLGNVKTLATNLQALRDALGKPVKISSGYGEQLLEHFRKLFHILHRREEYASEQTFRRALERVRNELVYDATLGSPLTNESENLADRFYLHIDSYFRFITTPGIEPTNNLAEQAIRFVAIHRRLTQGTRSEAGQTWCERIWTAIATCEQQGRSVFHFLAEAVTAYFASSPAPSLVPDT
jgi:transposase